jgi:hypothetical protein
MSCGYLFHEAHTHRGSTRNREPGATSLRHIPEWAGSFPQPVIRHTQPTPPPSVVVAPPTIHRRFCVGSQLLALGLPSAQNVEARPGGLSSTHGACSLALASRSMSSLAHGGLVVTLDVLRGSCDVDVSCSWEWVVAPRSVLGDQGEAICRSGGRRAEADIEPHDAYPMSTSPGRQAESPSSGEPQRAIELGNGNS